MFPSRRLSCSWLIALLACGTVRADQSFPAHRVVGNVYYVGSDELATYLIATPEGHVLINSGFEETVPLIRASVESLGFQMTDVKFLLASHAHADHVAGHARLQQLTGAKVLVMRGDHSVIAEGGQGQYLYADSRWAPCKVDRVLDDGDEVKLGGTTLVARSTPGHTRGCTTWTWQVTDGDKKHNVVVVGSPNVNPGYQLVGNLAYPEIADDFAKTFAVLKALPCDVFLGAHGNYYGLRAKHDRLAKSGANPFIDPQGYKAYVAEREQAYRTKLAEQRAEQASPIRAGLQPFVERQELAGAVIPVANKQQVLSLSVVGFADIVNGRPMQPDSLFWIASQSKPITDRVGHGGAYSTNSYLDTKTGLILVWLVQHAGFPGKGGESQEAFRRAALEGFAR